MRSIWTVEQIAGRWRVMRDRRIVATANNEANAYREMRYLRRMVNKANMRLARG